MPILHCHQLLRFIKFCRTSCFPNPTLSGGSSSRSSRPSSTTISTSTSSLATRNLVEYRGNVISDTNLYFHAFTLLLIGFEALNKADFVPVEFCCIHPKIFRQVFVSLESSSVLRLLSQSYTSKQSRGSRAAPVPGSWMFHVLPAPVWRNGSE